MSSSIAINSTTSSSENGILAELIHLKNEITRLLSSEGLLEELGGNDDEGPELKKCLNLLDSILVKTDHSLSEDSKFTTSYKARIYFIKGWSEERKGMLLNDLHITQTPSLESYSVTAELLGIKDDQERFFESLPSVSRPRELKNAIQFERRENWVGEYLAERARATLTVAYTLLNQLFLNPDANQETKDEILLAIINHLDLGCRQNIQTLFTSLEEDPDSSLGPVDIVVGNTRLLEDIIHALPAFPNSEWCKRLDWSTHISDVVYVEAALSANRLIESASRLSRSVSEQEREEVRKELEAIVTELVPLEERQGKVLARLAKTMIAAMKATQTIETSPLASIPAEAAAILSRAIQHLENAYTSSKRAFEKKKKPLKDKRERRMLRRLENLYCVMEELNKESDIAKSERIARGELILAVIWIRDC